MANITWLGNNYVDVPYVELPQTGGGTVTFYENGGVDGDNLAYGASGGAVVGSAIVGTAVVDSENGAVVGSAIVGTAQAG